MNKRTEPSQIVPFWQRSPRFFIAPAHPDALLRILGLSGLLIFANKLPLPYPLDLMLAYALIWLVFVQYCYRVIEQTAAGRLSPAQYKNDTDPALRNRPYKQWVVLVLMVFVLELMKNFVSEFGAWALQEMFTLVIPASVMSIALQNSIRSAINPFVLLHLMRAIGWPYLGLCFLLNMLSYGARGLFTLVAPRVPDWLAFPLMNAFAMYFTLIMCNMLGYVLYQYHEAIGVEVDQAETPEVAEAEQESPEITLDIAERILQGDLKTALNLAFNAQRDQTDSIPAALRYFRLLMLAGNNAAKLEQGRRLISMLMRSRQERLVPEVYGQCLTVDPAFFPFEPYQVMRTAQHARSNKAPQVALQCIEAFRNLHPRHGDIPAALLLKARILCEDCRQDREASQVLRDMIAAYPAHELTLEAERYLGLVSKLRSA